MECTHRTRPRHTGKAPENPKQAGPATLLIQASVDHNRKEEKDKAKTLQDTKKKKMDKARKNVPGSQPDRHARPEDHRSAIAIFKRR